MSTPQPRNILRGQRRCTECRYRLEGQPIVNEEHYGLFIVRCPECGAVANPREYSVVGRWSWLYTVALALSWGVLVLGLWFFGAFAMHGMAIGCAEAGASIYGQHLNDVYRLDTAPAPIVDASGTTTPPPQAQPIMFLNWWPNEDHAAHLAAQGGWTGAVSWNWLWLLLPQSLGSFTLGCLWAMILYRLRWRGYLLLTLLGVLPAVFLLYLHWQTLQIMGPIWGRVVAVNALGGPLMAAGLGVGGVMLLLGLFLGRRVGRRVVSFCIPLRMQGGMSALWMTDGLVPPWVAHLTPRTLRPPPVPPSHHLACPSTPRA